MLLICVNTEFDFFLWAYLVDWISDLYLLVNAINVATFLEM